MNKACARCDFYNEHKHSISGFSVDSVRMSPVDGVVIWRSNEQRFSPCMHCAKMCPYELERLMGEEDDRQTT